MILAIIEAAYSKLDKSERECSPCQLAFFGAEVSRADLA